MGDDDDFGNFGFSEANSSIAGDVTATGGHVSVADVDISFPAASSADSTGRRRRAAGTSTAAGGRGTSSAGGTPAPVDSPVAPQDAGDGTLWIGITMRGTSTLVPAASAAGTPHFTNAFNK